MSKVAIYIRWSTEDQGQGTTLEVQSEACRQYCDRQGWYVPDDMVIVDEGYSGGSLLRPGLTRVRKMVQTGLVDTLVVYRLDRLSRNLADATTLVDKELKNKAVVRSATEDVQPEADEGWLNYSFRAAFADYERRVIRQRTMAGRIRRHQEGRKAHGKIPYGWQPTNRKAFLELHPEHAEVVRELFWKCVHQNMGAPALARWINEKGIPAPEGSKWHQSVIRRLLQNPIYGGRIVFGRRKQLKQSAAEPGPWRQLRPPVVDVEADPDCLPPIIERELWELAQRSIQNRGEHIMRGRAVSNPHLLSGLLYCRCGSKMGPKTNPQRKRNRTSVYYRCYRNEEVERCHVQSAYLEAHWLEEHIEACVVDHLRSDTLPGRVDEWLNDQDQDDMTLLTEERHRIEQERRKLEDELAYVDKQYRRQEITIAEARRLRAGVEAEVAASTARQEQIDTQLQKVNKSRLDYAWIVAQLDQVRNWTRLSTLEKKVVMSQFVVRIEAYQPRTGGDVEVTIDWRYAENTELQVARPVRRRNAK